MSSHLRASEGAGIRDFGQAWGLIDLLPISVVREQAGPERLELLLDLRQGDEEAPSDLVDEDAVHPEEPLDPVLPPRSRS